MLQFKGVCKTFQGPDGEVHALNDVSFALNAGEVVAIQGPSGCGKTTLLLIAGSLLRPTAGAVSVRGKDPYTLNSKARSALRAEKIGFVFQQFHLVPYLTVLKNVLTPSVPVPRDNARERAQALVRHFGLDHRANYLPGQLSTGECQRVALARALLNSPQLVLADEPSGNLDDKNSEIVFTHLREYADRGGSVLMVTHDPRAARHADRKLHMERGRLQPDQHSDAGQFEKN